MIHQTRWLLIFPDSQTKITFLPKLILSRLDSLPKNFLMPKSSANSSRSQDGFLSNIYILWALSTGPLHGISSTIIKASGRLPPPSPTLKESLFRPKLCWTSYLSFTISKLYADLIFITKTRTVFSATKTKKHGLISGNVSN